MTDIGEAAALTASENDNDRRLIGAAELKRQLGGVSDSWIQRALRDETLRFPRPMKIRGRRFWRRGDIARWIDDRSCQ